MSQAKIILSRLFLVWLGAVLVTAANRPLFAADSAIGPATPAAAALNLPSTMGEVREAIQLRRLVVLGPPGVGKGTLAERLARDLGICHISTGEMLRREVAAGSPLGRAVKTAMENGQLVPYQTVISILVNRVKQPDCAAGYLLDGSPRRVTEARALEQRLGEAGIPVQAALDLEADDAVVHARLEGRRVCPKCGTSYHVLFNKPRVTDHCDRDGETLVQRKDDQPQVIAERLEVYHRETAPVSEFYEQRGIRFAIDAGPSPAEVEAVALKVLWKPQLFH